jgi:PAS domain S-box-containing protein
MAESADAASDSGDQQRLFQSICDILVRTGLFQLAWFGYADESARKTVEPIASAGDQEGVLHDLQIALGQTDCEDPSSVVIRTEEVRWIKALHRSAAIQRGYTSVLSIPVMWDGWPAGALTLYYGDPDRFGEVAVRILKEQLGLAQAAFTRRARLPRPRSEEHEAELRELLDLIPQHIMLISANMRILYVNRTELEYHGHALEDVRSGAAVPKIIHPDDLERVALEFTTGFSTGAAFEYKIRLRRKDGQYRWFVVQASPLRDEQGHIIRWCTTGTDIEDRKQAEVRIRKENLSLLQGIDRALMFEESVGNSESDSDPHVVVHRAASPSAHYSELACAAPKVPVPSVDLEPSKPFAPRGRKAQMAHAVQVVSSHLLGVLDIESALSIQPALVDRLLPHAASEADALKGPNFPRLFLLDGCSLTLPLGPLSGRLRANSPGSKILALLDPDRSGEAEMRSLFYWGIDGMLVLDEEWKTELAKAVFALLSDRLWVPEQVLLAFVKQVKILLETQLLPQESLTMRESQVLQLLFRRLTNKEIATELKMSERTAKFHVSNVLSKLGFKNRRDLLHNTLG